MRDHPLEVAIVLLTPPFLPASLQAARVFRLLRLLRLLRAALLMRRLLSTEGVRDAAVLALVTVLGGGVAFASVEKGQDLSAWDGVWWAIVTVTTVGYGDTYPHTTAGRIIAIVVMLVGIGFVAILTAAAAERFVQAQQEAQRERQDLAAPPRRGVAAARGAGGRTPVVLQPPRLRPEKRASIAISRRVSPGARRIRRLSTLLEFERIGDQPVRRLLSRCSRRDGASGTR